MRQLAYIETIKSLRPIEGADKIECATILGWEVIVKRGEFKVGDTCVYVEIDSILPSLLPFEFLRSRKWRVKTISMRSQISQGIVFPLSVINEVDPSIDISKLKVGDDVTEALKIVKYDPESELDEEPEKQVKKSWLANKYSYYKWKLLGVKPVKGINGFPSDVPKTNEERVQKMGRALEARVGEPVYITEKVEGTSATFIFRKNANWLAKLFSQDGIFQACSRNRIVYNSQKGGKTAHHLLTVEAKYNIHQGMKKLNRNLAIQGEIIGPKIQKNIYKVSEYEFRVFNVFDIDQQRSLALNEMQMICNEMILPMVPLDSLSSIKNDIKYYVELSKGKSMINPKVEREGIVICSLTDNFSFKSINPNYLLHQE